MRQAEAASLPETVWVEVVCGCSGGAGEVVEEVAERLGLPGGSESRAVASAEVPIWVVEDVTVEDCEPRPTWWPVS